MKEFAPWFFMMLHWILTNCFNRGRKKTAVVNYPRSELFYQSPLEKERIYVVSLKAHQTE